ncbi:hypothetical protein V2J09_000063 [Rumex salicifolius]
MAAHHSSFSFFFLLFALSIPSHSADPFLRRHIKASGGDGAVQPLWCVAKNNAEDTALQQALNWACGPGAADCGPIQQGGSCYDPNDLLGMASYAFNNYCVKNGMTDDACNFSNTAALTSLDPSHDGCKLPSSSVNVVNATGSSSVGPGVDTGAIADMSSSTVLHFNTQFWTPFITLFVLLFAVPSAMDARLKGIQRSFILLKT